MKIVAYYRVSTEKQEKSGLGLDAQRETIAAYAKSENATIVARFTEQESGRNAARPQLAKAIAKARALKATLCIAKLDRLARNVAFTSALMESKVTFVACDCPKAGKFTIHILAAVAEHEARVISERTKAALAAAKRRGQKLGTHRRGHRIDWKKGMKNGLEKARTVAAASRAVARNDCYADLLPEMEAMRKAGHSFAAIADELNQQEHTTTTGKKFSAMTVHRLLA